VLHSRPYRQPIGLTAAHHSPPTAEFGRFLGRRKSRLITPTYVSHIYHDFYNLHTGFVNLSPIRPKIVFLLGPRTKKIVSKTNSQFLSLKIFVQKWKITNFMLKYKCLYKCYMTRRSWRKRNILRWAVTQFIAALYICKFHWKYKIRKISLKTKLMWKQFHGDWSQIPAKRTYRKPTAWLQIPVTRSEYMSSPSRIWQKLTVVVLWNVGLDLPWNQYQWDQRVTVLLFVNNTKL
jgi:hypothetical protein